MIVCFKNRRGGRGEEEEEKAIFTGNRKQREESNKCNMSILFLN